MGKFTEQPWGISTSLITVISILRIGGRDNIAAAIGHHAGHPDHALALVLTMKHDLSDTLGLSQSN